MLLALLAGADRAQAAPDPCTAPAPVCAARASVFAVSSGFDPYASAVRIGPDLLVTNRHGVADDSTVTIVLANGERVAGAVVPTAYKGDLVLIRADLPEGPVLGPAGEAGGDLYVIGQDISARRIRAFPKGEVLKQPAADHPFARLHHTAYNQPGVSGGALVTETGAFVGIATSGGEGRFEAIPAARIAALKAASGDTHTARSAEIGKAYRECIVDVEKALRVGDALPDTVAARIQTACGATGNRQLFDLAAQALGRAKRFEPAIAFFERSLDKDPNAINSRLGLVIVLSFARRHEQAVPHVRWLLETIPKDPGVARYALQVGKFAGDTALAERGLALIAKHAPRQLDAAKRFYESDGRPPH